MKYCNTNIDSTFDPVDDLNASRLSDSRASNINVLNPLRSVNKVDYTWRINARNNMRQ